MNDLHKMRQESSVLRWGGLAGVLGGLLFILALVVVIVGPVGMEEPAELAEWVARFPDIQTARVVENLVYLTGLILQIPLFLALYRALRGTALAPALFGSVLGIVGLTVMAAGSTPHVAHAPLAELYHAPGASPADQAAIALMWQAVWGMFDAMLYVGFFVVPLGILLLGAAMLRSPAFRGVFGVLTLALGLVGLAGAVLQMVDPASMVGSLSYFAALIFYLVAGGKLIRLSRAR